MNSSSGLGMLEVLAIIFICAKLFGIIDWSWWWVLFPIWGGFLPGLLILAVSSLIVRYGEKTKKK